MSKRWLLVGCFLVMATAVYFLAKDYLTFDIFHKYRQELNDLVTHHPALSPVLYVCVFIIFASLSIPSSLLLSILGGFLFPQPWCTLYVVISATIGATVIFSLAKTTIGEYLRQRTGPFLKKMERGFQKNAISYLFFLRFIPLFPFWIVNLAPAFFGIRLRTFVWTTFLGIIPISFVYTQTGAGLGEILDSDGKITIYNIFNGDVEVALVVLAVFALMPFTIKKLMKSYHKHHLPHD